MESSKDKQLSFYIPRYPINMSAVVASPPYDGVDWATHVVLQSNDAKPVEFKVLKDAAKMSGLIKDMLEDQGKNEKSVIPIPNVNERTLWYVIEYVDHHYNNRAEVIEKPLCGKVEDVISEWDKQFLYTDLVKGGDERQHELLIDVIMAAHFLNINDLMHLTCACAASMMRGKTPEQIKALFSIENDFTPEEEKKIREQNRWCEEADQVDKHKVGVSNNTAKASTKQLVQHLKTKTGRGAVFFTLQCYVEPVLSFLGPRDAMLLVLLRPLNSAFHAAVAQHTAWGVIARAAHVEDEGEDDALDILWQLSGSVHLLKLCWDVELSQASESLQKRNNDGDDEENDEDDDDQDDDEVERKYGCGFTKNNNFLSRFFVRLFNTTSDTSWLLRRLHEEGLDLAGTWYPCTSPLFDTDRAPNNGGKNRQLSSPFAMAALHKNYTVMQTLLDLNRFTMQQAHLYGPWVREGDVCGTPDFFYPVLHVAVFLSIDPAVPEAERASWAEMREWLLANKIEDPATFGGKWVCYKKGAVGDDADGDENTSESKKNGYEHDYGLDHGCDLGELLANFVFTDTSRCLDTALQYAIFFGDVVLATRLVANGTSKRVLSVPTLKTGDFPVTMCVEAALSPDTSMDKALQYEQLIRELLAHGARANYEYEHDEPQGDYEYSHASPFHAALRGCRWDAPVPERAQMAERIARLLYQHHQEQQLPPRQGTASCSRWPPIADQLRQPLSTVRGRVGMCWPRDAACCDRYGSNDGCQFSEPMFPLAVLSVFDNVYHGENDTLKLLPPQLPRDHPHLSMIRFLLDEGVKWPERKEGKWSSYSHEIVLGNAHLPQPTLIAAAAGDAELVTRLVRDGGCSADATFHLSWSFGRKLEPLDDDKKHAAVVNRALANNGAAVPVVSPMVVAENCGYADVQQALEQLGCGGKKNANTKSNTRRRK